MFELTRRNLAALALDLDILNCDYVCGRAGVAASNDQLLVLFIAPPWCHALTTSGPDLRRTEPPVADIVASCCSEFPTSPLLFAIRGYEVVDPDSLAELQHRFDWSRLRTYVALNVPGQNHGLFLGSRRPYTETRG